MPKTGVASMARNSALKIELLLGCFHLKTYTALHSCCKESLVGCQLAWWLIAVRVAVKSFLHYASRVGHSSTTSATDFSMADIAVPFYSFFSFPHKVIRGVTKLTVKRWIHDAICYTINSLTQPKQQYSLIPNRLTQHLKLSVSFYLQGFFRPTFLRPSSRLFLRRVRFCRPCNI